jgi:hypothetical protein
MKPVIMLPEVAIGALGAIQVKKKSILKMTK